MRVKLQLVICHDEGHEETVTDVITLNTRYVHSQQAILAFLIAQVSSKDTTGGSKP